MEDLKSEIQKIKLIQREQMQLMNNVIELLGELLDRVGKNSTVNTPAGFHQ